MAKRSNSYPYRNSPHYVALWDAINKYAEACGGDSSSNTISVTRMNCVVEVEKLLLSITQDAWNKAKQGGRPHACNIPGCVACDNPDL